MSALAVLAVAAARPTPSAPMLPTQAGAASQPADWADTGILPASADKSPPAEIGMVKVSVPEARRLLRLATTLMSSTACQLGYAWSTWRRKYQARPLVPLPGTASRLSGMNCHQVINRDCSTGFRITLTVPPYAGYRMGPWV